MLPVLPSRPPAVRHVPGSVLEHVRHFSAPRAGHRAPDVSEKRQSAPMAGFAVHQAGPPPARRHHRHRPFADLVSDLGLIGVLGCRGRQIKHRAVVRSRQLALHPPRQGVEGSQRRDALMLNRCQDGAANENLAARVPFAVRHARACDQTRALSAQAGETIRSTDTSASGGGLGHAPIVGVVSRVLDSRRSPCNLPNPPAISCSNRIGATKDLTRDRTGPSDALILGRAVSANGEQDHRDRGTHDDGRHVELERRHQDGRSRAPVGIALLPSCAGR